MYAPQIILIVYMSLILGVNLAKHGQPILQKTYDLRLALFRLFIWNALLWWGGFWW